MENSPLADRIRPDKLEDFVGQTHLLSENCELKSYFRNNKFPSMIFWGPPGSGKTTLAKIIKKNNPKIPFYSESAVLVGVNKIREIGEYGKKGLFPKVFLFLDEIHRFSKSQQDVLLPYAESGVITLIGCTTENPSFYVTSPLLSRTRLFIFNPLSESEILKILKRARHISGQEGVSENVLLQISQFSEGDARIAINIFESLMDDNTTEDEIEKKLERILLFDKRGDFFYDTISAFHKSVRSSDPQGALYYLARMILSGVDPLYVLRRMIRIASEDIGMSDPNALVVAVQARQAFDYVGMPEAELAIVEAAIYLSTAPKSNSVYTAWAKVISAVKKSGNLPVPIHLRNAPTKLAKSMGHGKEYKYDHDYPNAFSGQETLPPSLSSKVFYSPSERGFEKEIKKRIAFWQKKRGGINENL
ncbi:replication-associated recombination protein A [candidate division WOR-3 bacterium]|nr:replication-associated recombination protein A [candidate division WOR-3 bacterium]